MNFIYIILSIAVGYVIGSIPWALIIGKVFFNKDIRNYGSGNLGGTNAGRVLGKPIGLLVIFLDASKALLLMTALNFIYPNAIPFAGLAVSIGHCFPLFANFKGGKGVACAMGYLFGLGIFGFADFIFVFVYPFLAFILVLGISKMVSLSSMVALLVAAIISFITSTNINISIMISLLALFVIYRHSANIKRIIQGKESKITWIK